MSPGSLCRPTRVRGRPTVAIVVLSRGDAVVGSWRLDRPDGLDLGVVNQLSRLQLAACRAGCSIRLCDTCQELSQLLDLVGLSEVLPTVPL
jgi:hypothetical protein